MASKNREQIEPIPFLILFILVVALAYSALRPSPSPIGAPSLLFSDPSARLSELSDPAFSRQLFIEAVAYEPLLNASGTQVHMGFWSGAGNHGSLVRLLDDVNSFHSSSGQPMQRAIWDEGAQSSLQYPSYVRMNAQEKWYERAAANGSKVLIYGVNYTDPYNVSFAQADALWGAYSVAYADLASFIRNSTGKKVQVWCYVQGARANRIFYAYEYPELQKLEQAGAVEVHFAKSADANWKNPNDWFFGTANAPAPAG